MYYVQFVSVCEFYVWDVLERVCVCVCVRERERESMCVRGVCAGRPASTCADRPGLVFDVSAGIPAAGLCPGALAES